MINYMAMTQEELCFRLEASYATNRKLNRRCSTVEAELERALKAVGGMARQLGEATARVREYARSVKWYKDRLHKDFNEKSLSEEALRRRVSQLDEQLRKQMSYRNDDYKHRREAEDEVRRLQAENHELRMKLAEREGKQL